MAPINNDYIFFFLMAHEQVSYHINIIRTRRRSTSSCLILHNNLKRYYLKIKFNDIIVYESYSDKT